MKKKVIYTGPSGFIGKNIKEFYGNYYDLIPYSIRYQNNQTIKLEGDILLHLGGKAHDFSRTSTSSDFEEANFLLTKQLYDAFLESDCTKFIYISSIKAVADFSEEILDEEITPHPHTDYGISKLKAENYIINKNTTQNKSYIILRPCMIHGNGNKGNLNFLYNFIKKGIPFPFGNFESKRSFLSFENLAFILKEIIDRTEIPNGIYNVSDNEPLKITKLVKIIAKALDKKVVILKIPVKLIYLIAKIGNSINLFFNTENVNKLTQNYIVSNEKILSVIKCELPLTSEEGIYKTIIGFKND